MKKLKWILRHDQVEQLHDIIETYLEEREWRTIAEKWVQYEIRNLGQRLAKLKWNTDTKLKLTLPAPECFAFVALFIKHPLDRTNYTDNLIQIMLNDINQRYA